MHATLCADDKCFVQNQTGQHAKRWHYTGTVMEVLPHDKYGIRIKGSNRANCINRRFVKKYTPASLTVPHHNHVSPMYTHVLQQKHSQLWTRVQQGRKYPRHKNNKIKEHVVYCLPIRIFALDVVDTHVLGGELFLIHYFPVIQCPSRGRLPCCFETACRF